MTILLTGTHGFVGSNLVSAFKEHHIIYGLDIVSPEKEGIIKTYSWNEFAMLPEVDTVIHLAGKAHDTKNKSEAKTYFEINTELTKKIFDYFLQSKAKQFIFFSSVKAAADTVEGDCLTEDVIPKPVGPYGESKIAAENYINFQFSIFNSQFKNVYIFRPCMIHGPGNKGNLNLLYNIVNKGIPWPLGAFENKRSFLNIRNLSYIVEQFILQNPESGIYHLADDEPISTNELIELIARSKIRKARIWKLNRPFITAMAKFGTVCNLPFNSERLRKLTENYVVSNQKMKTALKINNLPVDIRTGFKQTFIFFE
jgi:nucleoside-diphosphate-sugar epimerase